MNLLLLFFNHKTSAKKRVSAACRLSAWPTKTSNRALDIPVCMYIHHVQRIVGYVLGLNRVVTATYA